MNWICENSHMSIVWWLLCVLILFGRLNTHIITSLLLLWHDFYFLFEFPRDKKLKFSNGKHCRTQKNSEQIKCFKWWNKIKFMSLFLWYFMMLLSNKSNILYLLKALHNCDTLFPSAFPTCLPIYTTERGNEGVTIMFKAMTEDFTFFGIYCDKMW